MAEGQEKDIRWLVRSNNNIIGPFYFDQVVEAIFRGEIHILDEIVGPFQRWRPIRDHSLFSAAIEKLKSSLNEQESTHTDTVISLDELTQTSTNISGSGKSGGAKPSGAKKKQVVQRRKTPLAASEVDTYSASQKEAPYIIPDEPEAKKHVAFVVTLVLTSAALFGYKFYKSRIQHSDQPPAEQVYSQATDDGLKALEVGDFETATGLFQKARVANPNDPNLWLEMSPLILHFANKPMAVKDKIQTLVLGQPNLDQAKAHNILSLTFSHLNKFELALSENESALNINETFYPAVINKIYLLFGLGRYSEAVNAAEMAKRLRPGDVGLASYLELRALLGQGDQTNSEKIYQEVVKRAQNFANHLKAYDFLQEILFLKALASSRLNPTKKIDNDVQQFLNVDSSLTDLHNHSIHLDYQAFRWQSLKGDCLKMVGAVTADLGGVLKGFCHLKNRETLSAKQIFEGLLRKWPKNSLIRGLLVSTLVARGELNGQSALSFLKGVEKRRLLADTLIRSCLREGDLKCAQRVNTSAGQEVSLLYQYWLAAAVAKGPSKALQSAIEISPRFIPTLEIQAELRERNQL